MRVLVAATVVLAGLCASISQAGEVDKKGARANDVGAVAIVANQIDQGGTDAPPIPDTVVYLIYFRHLANVDQVAAAREAEGKDGHGWRTHEQRAAGLTDGEANLLKQIAYDCLQAVAETDGEMENVPASIPDQHPFGGFLRPPRQTVLAQLEDQKTQIITAHINQLKAQLGDDGFNKLATYLAQTFTASLRQQLIRLPSPTRLSGGGR